MLFRRGGPGHARASKLGSRMAGCAPRPRVLIEDTDRLAAFSYRCLLDGSGYEVTWCRGPGSFGTHRCALLETGHCQQVSDADVVVNALASDRPSARQILDALEAVYPEKPTIVKVETHTSDQPSSSVEGWCRASQVSATAMTLLDSIREAVTKPGPEND